MIEISIPSSINELAANLSSFDKDSMLREIATNIMPIIRMRVHEEGKDSNGNTIGTYSKGYMKVRTGNYPETRINKGKNKGQFREKKKKGQAGLFTKGNNKGQQRPVYNRSTDSTVILSLTRQMENDMQIIQTENGYGIGYSNEMNFNKAVWNEKRYKRIIWSLSDEELNIVTSIAERYVNNNLNAQ